MDAQKRIGNEIIVEGNTVEGTNDEEIIAKTVSDTVICSEEAPENINIDIKDDIFSLIITDIFED